LMFVLNIRLNTFSALSISPVSLSCYEMIFEIVSNHIENYSYIIIAFYLL